MICPPCRQAADLGEQGEAAHRARGCKGDCDCMHRTGSVEAMYNPDAVKQMVEHGLVQQGTLTTPEGESTRTVE